MILALVLALQSGGLPPANPLPLTDPDAAGVMAPVNRMLAAIGARNSAAILAEVRPDGGATAAVERADGSRSARRLTWAEFAGGIPPGPERLEERLTDVAVEIDGDIAMVWAPYVFLADGKARHCGVNHFDLLREGDRWRVLNVTWSQRTTGCALR